MPKLLNDFILLGCTHVALIDISWSYVHTLRGEQTFNCTEKIRIQHAYGNMICGQPASHTETNINSKTCLLQMCPLHHEIHAMGNYIILYCSGYNQLAKAFIVEILTTENPRACF